MWIWVSIKFLWNNINFISVLEFYYMFNSGLLKFIGDLNGVAFLIPNMPLAKVKVPLNLDGESVGRCNVHDIWNLSDKSA